VLAGCGSSSPVKGTFRDGIESIRRTHDAVRLRTELRRTIARLRSERDVKGRRLALRGFQSTLRGVEAQIDFHENDRGNIRAATRDARRANAGLGEGARLLRAAGRQLGVQVGTLNGY
jgi:hypothetical protein